MRVIKGRSANRCIDSATASGTSDGRQVRRPSHHTGRRLHDASSLALDPREARVKPSARIAARLGGPRDARPVEVIDFLPAVDPRASGCLNDAHRLARGGYIFCGTRDRQAVIATWSPGTRGTTVLAQHASAVNELVADSVIEDRHGTLWVGATEFDRSARTRSVLLWSSDAGKSWQRKALDAFAESTTGDRPRLVRMGDAVYLQARLSVAGAARAEGVPDLGIYALRPDGSLQACGVVPGRASLHMISATWWFNSKSDYVSELLETRDAGATWTSLTFPREIGPFYVKQVVAIADGVAVVGVQYDKRRREMNLITLRFDARGQLTHRNVFVPQANPEMVPEVVQYDAATGRLWAMCGEQAPSGAFGLIAYSDDNGREWTTSQRFQSTARQFTTFRDLVLDGNGGVVVVGQSTLNPRQSNEVCAAAFKYSPA